MNIEVTQKADGWMLGTIEGGYEWQAKVYEKPSEFGINGGRVSKLFIRPVGLGWQPALISYDRGWDKRPETQDATVKVIRLGREYLTEAGLADRQPSHNNVPLKLAKAKA